MGLSGRKPGHVYVASYMLLVNPGARLSGEGTTRAKCVRTSGEAVFQAVPVPISSLFLCPRPPLLFSAPNQNRHATLRLHTQATLRLATL